MSDETSEQTPPADETPTPPTEPTAPTAPRRPSAFHPVSIGHLVMGLVFLSFVGIWALVESDAVEWHDLRWLFPLPWLIAGAAGLVAVAASSIRKHR
jgi:hypothetical protein